jgi:hypothetical protein
LALGSTAFSVIFYEGQTVGSALVSPITGLSVAGNSTTISSLLRVQQGASQPQIQLNRTDGSIAAQFYWEPSNNTVFLTSRTSDGSGLASYIQMPSQGTFGSISVSGTKGGFAGIHFSGLSSNIHLMTSGDPMAGSFHIGFANNSGTWPLQVGPGGALVVPGNVTAYSDERLKHNIRPLEHIALSRIAALGLFKFERDDVDIEQVGVMAQALQELLPECVTEAQHNHITKAKYLAVDYGRAALVLTLMLARELEKRTH